MTRVLVDLAGRVPVARHVPAAGRVAGRVCIDLTGRGIGNIVLMLACALRVSRALDAGPPVVVGAPPNLGDHVVKELFEFADEQPADCVLLNPTPMCSLTALAHSDTRAAMRELVLPDHRVHEAVDAGFSIRTTNPAFDGDATYMNDAALQAMKREMAKYAKVMVFSNDAANLRDLPPNAVVAEFTRGDVRNVDSHWAQWHALARCPVVYHPIAGSGSLTSTFAPVAAAYGDGIPMGVDNHGVVCGTGTFENIESMIRGAVPDVDGHGVVYGVVHNVIIPGPPYRW